MKELSALMGVRESIRVIDATMRDGGIVNDFKFTDEFVKALYQTNIAAGMDSMEVGYKASKKRFDQSKFGKWKFSDDEDIFKVIGDNADKKVKLAVRQMQKMYPTLAIDDEMQLGFALDKELRDEQYPFTKLKGKDVNTLIFPNLTSARSSYKMLQSLNADVEIIGPIQMGLNKPIHFIDFGSTVRDVVNITAVAVIDAFVDKVKKMQG